LNGGEIAAALLGAGCVLLCFIAAAWADRRYSRFERLPGLFGISGKAARLDPRRLALYLHPVLAVAILGLALFLVLIFGVPTQGSLVAAFIGIGLSFAFSMAFYLWLIERWSRT